MKKLLACLTMLSVSSAWAAHLFTVCYYNQTNAPISYNNDGVSHKWKNRGELVGNGQVLPGQNKCFSNIVDETMFSKDYITFYIGNKWVGIVNPGFAKPYVISQDAQAKKGGKLTDNTNDGKDNYTLNIFVTDSGFVYSNSSDVKSQVDIITPRTFN